MLKQALNLFLLSPLSYLWDQVYRVRRVLYNYHVIPKARFSVPIISVGNLTFGGTGKTPFTIWLADYLISQGLSTVVLMRGYKGNYEKGVGLIRGGNSFRYNPLDYGDEALLISRRLKNVTVIVGKKRSKNLEFHFEELRPDVVVLDDGFQHLKLDRDLNVVLFDALMPLEKYKTAPRGYLREGKSALKDAHVIVFSRADQVSEERLNELKEFLRPYCLAHTHFAEIFYKTKGIFDMNNELILRPDQLKGVKVIGVVGIASPNSFFKLLESLGADIVDRMVFPDHHYFTLEEVKDFVEKAAKCQAKVIVSEKDIVKIKRVFADQKIYYLAVDVAFKSGEEAMKSKILEILKGQ